MEVDFFLQIFLQSYYLSFLKFLLHRILFLIYSCFPVTIKRGEAKKIFEDLRTGDPITDKNLIIRQYFEANKSFYEDMSKLRRVYDAVKTLGMRDETIEKIFGARNEIPLYQNIEDNQFSPLLISKRAALQFAQLAEDKGIPNVLTDEILEVIEQMSLDMAELGLNQDFTLDIENYVIPTGDEASLITPPLPKNVVDAYAIVTGKHIWYTFIFS